MRRYGRGDIPFQLIVGVRIVEVILSFLRSFRFPVHAWPKVKLLPAYGPALETPFVPVTSRESSVLKETDGDLRRRVRP